MLLQEISLLLTAFAWRCNAIKLHENCCIGAWWRRCLDRTNMDCVIELEPDRTNASCVIVCRCLELEPNNSTALMSLAVSYTNESLRQQACDTLYKWLKLNPLYSHMVPAMSDGAQRYGLHVVDYNNTTLDF